MKLKSYFLLSIVVGMAFACSSDENVPEVEVFTPDATLSLATVADGKSLTKAGDETGTDPEDAINTLHVMVFYAASGNLQNDRVVKDSKQVEDLEVQSGNAKILVLANAGTTKGQFESIGKALEYKRSLDNETLGNGFSMSSKVIETTLEEGKHNIFGNADDFATHIPNVKKSGKILLTRHIAQINLKSVSVESENGEASFVPDSVFVANVKGYSLMASSSTTEWGTVETTTAPEGKSLWWYGQYADGSWNGKYKTTQDGLLEADLLGFAVSKVTVAKNSPWKPEKDEIACGKSFIVYENMSGAAILGQRTLLVLKGTYTDDYGKTEANRYYTISINDPDMSGSISTEGEDNGKVSHKYVKRNYRYNVTLTIKSSGSDRPYDPASEACMDVAVKVANWDVIEQNEDLD
ncbi:fimbrial protein [uncultured Parabacteroides sp.]|uniref:fimbrial protein n=2 Tax=uncultured Parabacteroides sp. TaxID=512312 RepID=UPI00265897E3|nr:fimbrial protein [uncultured Parabacteroides sp.]